MKEIIGGFNVGYSTTRVAAVIFSSSNYVKKMFTLERYYDKAKIYEVIDKQIHPSGDTYTGMAMDLVSREIYNTSQDRPDVPNVCIIITDGNADDKIPDPAERLRRTGTTIFAVGVGKNYNRQQLITITGNPLHVYTADFKELQSIITEIKESACRGMHRTTFSYN